MTSRLTTWTYALLLGAFLLVCASVYILATQARDLASLRAQVEAQESRTRSAELLLAQRQSQLLVVNDALVANQRLLSSAGREAYVRACLGNRSGFTARELNLCELLRVTADPFGEFLGGYALAAGVRSAAFSREDFARSRRLYEELFPLAERARVTAPWLARVHEGIAYADYRMRSFARAQDEIGQASRLDPYSAFVALTALKIACAMNAPDQLVRDRYRQALARLQSAVRQPRYGMSVEDARLELSYFEQDPELRLVCAAGLGAATPGAPL